MNIGITGATGKLGRLVVRHLLTTVPASSLTALVRSPQKAADLGIAARAFDYNNAEQLQDALHGIDTLLLISANEVGQRERQHTNVLHAAQGAGISWIVYTSLLHADTSSLSLRTEHLATETAIKASGIPYTILRNGWYTENYTGSMKATLAGGAMIGSAGSGKISSAARSDYAAAAAAVLTGSGHRGKTYELAGDHAFTLAELAAEISRQAGKPIPYSNVPEAAYADILKKAGVPESYALAIASWDIGASKGDLFDDSKQLSALTGKPTTSLAQSVHDALTA